MYNCTLLNKLKEIQLYIRYRGYVLDLFLDIQDVFPKTNYIILIDLKSKYVYYVIGPSLTETCHVCRIFFSFETMHHFI